MISQISQLDELPECLPSAGVGALQTSAGNLPLVGLSVHCRVDGLLCRTVVRQRFRNTHQEFLNATYIFPLPGRHAVTACVMRVKDRTVRAELKERGAARAEYAAAIRSGRQAALAEEDRSETFSLQVGNIPPGEEATVELELMGVLAIVGEEATLRIPLVIAPLYTPGQPLDGPSVGLGTAVDTNQAPDASRVTPPTLLPGCPNPVCLAIEVELNPGELAPTADWRDKIRATLHSVLVAKDGPCVVKLTAGERVNRDFILRFPVLRAKTHARLDYTHAASDKPGVFALTITPPVAANAQRRPRDVAFVLDRSGSMGGWKMVASRRALGRIIDSLRDGDRFRALAFDDTVESLPGHDDWRPATDRNRWQALEWLGQIDARGGTELGPALCAAWRPWQEHAPEQDRERIVVIVTDGQTSGEDSILHTLHTLTAGKPPRVFTLGVDRAVNASLLQRLADWGGGVFELIESERRLDEVMDRMQTQIASVALSNVRITPLDFDLLAQQTTPVRTPDLFAERPITLYGRVGGRRNEIRLKITATAADGSPWEQQITARRSELPMLLPLWGRSLVRDLEDQYAANPRDKKLQEKILAVSLESGVLSRFTAFVAVDSEVVNTTGESADIVQAVEQPEGWLMKLTAGAKRMISAAAPPGKQRALPRRKAKSPQGDEVECERGSRADADLSQALLGSVFDDDVVSESLSVPPPLRSPAARSPQVFHYDSNIDDTVSLPPPPASAPAQPVNAAELLPESIAREAGVMPVSSEDGVLRVKMSDPNDWETLEKLRLSLNQDIVAEPASAEEIQQEINEKYSQIEGESADSMLQEFTDTAIDFTATEDYSGLDAVVTKDSAPVIKLVQMVLAEAWALRASYIYVEPTAAKISVHFIIDGKARERDKIPLRIHNALLSRIVGLANLPSTDKLAEGGIKIMLCNAETNLRMYLIPTVNGVAVLLKFSDAVIPWSSEAELPELVQQWLAAAVQAAASDPAALEPIYERLRADCGV